MIMSLTQQIELGFEKIQNDLDEKANIHHTHISEEIASISWGKLLDIPSDLMYMSAITDKDSGLLAINISGTSTESNKAKTADKLTTPITVNIVGDARCSFTFDGSEDVDCKIDLSKTGVVAGEYNSASTISAFTVNDQGRIINVADPEDIAPSWNNVKDKPATIAGYGITDAESIAVLWSNIKNKPTTLEECGIEDAVNKSDTSIVASPNKILVLNENGELPASITGSSSNTKSLSDAVDYAYEWSGKQTFKNSLVTNICDADTLPIMVQGLDAHCGGVTFKSR